MEYAFIERGELDQMLRASQLSSTFLALALLGEKDWRKLSMADEDRAFRA